MLTSPLVVGRMFLANRHLLPVIFALLFLPSAGVFAVTCEEILAGLQESRPRIDSDFRREVKQGNRDPVLPYRPFHRVLQVEPTVIDLRTLAEAERSLWAAFKLLYSLHSDQQTASPKDQRSLSRSMMQASTIWLRGNGVAHRIHRGRTIFGREYFWIEISTEGNSKLNSFARQIWNESQTELIYAPSLGPKGYGAAFKKSIDTHSRMGRLLIANSVSGENRIFINLRAVIHLSADGASVQHENRHREIELRQNRRQPYLFYPMASLIVPRDPEDPRAHSSTSPYDRLLAFEELETYGLSVDLTRQKVLAVLDGSETRYDIHQAWRDFKSQPEQAYGIALRMRLILKLVEETKAIEKATFSRRASGLVMARLVVIRRDVRAVFILDIPLVDSPSEKDADNPKRLQDYLAALKMAVPQFVDAYQSIYRICMELDGLDFNKPEDKAALKRRLTEDFPVIPDAQSFRISP